jgi:diacylglycerol O-acyltransferase
MRAGDNALTLPPGKQLLGEKHGYIHEDWDVSELKVAAKKYKVTFNDFMMAMISVAIHRYFERKGRTENRICLSVPVSMRKTHKKVEELDLMNDVAPLVFEFDLHSEFEKALDLVKETTGAIRNSYIIYATYYGAKLMGLLPMILVLPVSNYISKRVTIVFSNVAGPKRPLVYDGFKCKKLAFLLPALGEISCGLSLISIDNKLKVGLLTDKNILEEPAEVIKLLDDVRREILNKS